MKKSQPTKRNKYNNTHTCGIEDMDALLNHIDEFSQFVKSHENLPDEQLQEEWRLFKTYIGWRIEDLTEDCYIYVSPTNKYNA